MRAFEILGLSIFSDIEKVKTAYEKKTLELSTNRQLYSDALYEKKMQELNGAKDECISYLSSTATDRIKKQAMEAYNYHKKENVLHDCGLWFCCTSCFSPECFEFGAATTSGSILGDFCCIDSLVCSPAAMVFYAILGAPCLSSEMKERSEKRETERKRQKALEEAASAERKKKQETERQERERRRIIANKTKEISQQAQFLEADTIRWKELSALTSCTIADIKCFEKLLRLIEEAGVDSDVDTIQKVRQNLAWYRDCAEEKQRILDRAQNVARLYRDIGNPLAAETLLDKYKL